MDQCFLFLLNLAWESRYKLPLLVTVCFMLLDVRLQLEITVEARRIRHMRHPPFPAAQHIDRAVPDENDDGNDTWSQTGSNDSWTTIEEMETGATDTATMSSYGQD